MPSVPSKKRLHWPNVCFVVHEAHVTTQPCRHTNSEAFPTLKFLCDIYGIKFSVVEVRAYKIVLRKLCGGTAHLRTL